MKKIIYSVAMYLRLSKDDMNIREIKVGKTHSGINGSIKSESNSISSQRELIHSFLCEQEDMKLYDIYADDGFSGGNFERPNFKRMIEDIDTGKVNCIIVKDLSRFSRDYIGAGRYIQKTFPAKGVRFIAITDGFDSLTAKGVESTIVLPIKNFINDSYCRDISSKVKSQQQIKRMNGEFIGSFAAYGYQKDMKNKNRLVVDEYAAHVVRNIFEWKIGGISAFAIAKKLNDLGILSPMEYKRSLGENFKTGFTGSGNHKWHAAAVKRILINEIYLGTMVQGRKEKINYKIKKLVEKPESEWVKVKNTHEAIITKDDFAIVQNLLQTDGRRNEDGESSLFMGLLFCAHCKEQMVRRKIRYGGKAKVFYICSTYNRGEGCSRHGILKEELSEVIFKECRVYSNTFFEQSILIEELRQKEVDFELIIRHDKEILRLQKEQDKFCKLSSGLYKDLCDGVITQKEFDKLYKHYVGNCERLEKALKNQKIMMNNLFQKGVAAKIKLERFRKCMELETIDRHTLVSMVERIYVYEDRRLELFFRYQNEFEYYWNTANMHEQAAKVD